MPKKKRRQPLNTPLSKRYDFDKGDLQTNQQGYISPYQRGRLWRMFLLNKVAVTVSVALVFFFFSILLFSIILTSESLAIQVISGSGIGVLLVLEALFVFTLYREWQKHSLDLDSEKVVIYEGKVQHRTHRTSRTTHYYISVGEMTFLVSYEQQSAFVNNAPYRIYATPYSDVILSAEPWEQAKHGDDEAADYFLEELAYQSYQTRY